jgi:hypothetical protein
MKKIQSALTALLVFTLLSSELYAQEQRKEIEVRIEYIISIMQTLILIINNI